MAKHRKKDIEYRRKNHTGSVCRVDRKDIRKQWMARVTLGSETTEDGKKKQIRKTIGYYDKEEEAKAALAVYIKDLESNGIVGAEKNKLKLSYVWERYVEERSTAILSESRKKAFGYNWNRIPEEMKNRSFEETNYEQWSAIFQKLRQEKSYATLKATRTDMIGLYKHAKKLEVTVPNYPEMFDLGPSPRKGKTLVFSKEQIMKIWELRNLRQGNKEARFAVDTVLILMYCGIRIDELLALKNEYVYMSEHYFEIVDAKTPAGDRRIPIHDAVYDIWQEYYDPLNIYFLTMPGTKKKYSYGNYRDSYWDELRDSLGWKEETTPKICRKTFSSYMKYYRVNSTVQKIIFGHTGALDTQERHYSVVPTSDIIREIKKIPQNPKDLIELVDEIYEVKN